MIDDSGDSFLGRWSRRKDAARRGEPLTDEPPPVAPAMEPSPAEPVARAEAPAELPPLDSLRGLESEYRDFLRPGVDPSTRSAALRKLFSDPHFNTMDRLDVYIDDYSTADPIPAAMLRTLVAARTLGLFDDEDRTPADGAAAEPRSASEDPLAEQPASDAPGAASEVREAPGAASEAGEAPGTAPTT